MIGFACKKPGWPDLTRAFHRIFLEHKQHATSFGSPFRGQQGTADHRAWTKANMGMLDHTILPRMMQSSMHRESVWHCALHCKYGATDVLLWYSLFPILQ